MAPCLRVVAWVVSDGGIEWFVCTAHSKPSPTARWTSRTPLAGWLHARGLPLPNPRLRCPTVTDAVADSDHP
jgi:hypothetical protein